MRAEGKVLASGVASVTASSVLPVKASVFQWTAPQNEVVDNLSLAVGQLFVLNNYYSTWQASVQAAIGGVGFVRFCLLVEYGAGNSQLQAWIDLRTGYVALPPCSFVRVSLIYESTDPIYTVSPAMSVPVSLVSGDNVVSDVPTYTMSRLFNGNWLLPYQAKTVEILSPGRIQLVGSGQTIVQEAAAPVPLVSPPWSPVRVVWATGGQNTFAWTNEPTLGYLGNLVFNLDL